MWYEGISVRAQLRDTSEYKAPEHIWLVVELQMEVRRMSILSKIISGDVHQLR